MDWQGAHAGFVMAAYVVSGAALALLVIYVFRRDSRARKTLESVELSGRE